MQFLKLIDKVKSDGQAQPLTRAIREAVHHNILKDYLEEYLQLKEQAPILTRHKDYIQAVEKI